MMALVVLAAACSLAAPMPLLAQAQKQPATQYPDVIFVPTPQEVVEDMLRLANVQKGDVLYDLGSGDGRIAITAARKYGIKATGIDIDPERIREANENAKKAGVTSLVQVRQENLFPADFRDATVITLYLLPDLNVKLRPKLWNELKPGTRIVSHQFEMGGWKPEKRLESNGRTIYFWTVPAKEKQPKLDEKKEKGTNNAESDASVPVGIARGSDAVQVVLPYVEVALAGDHRRVFHAQPPGMLFHRAPAGVGVLDVGLGMQLEKLELLVAQSEELAPAAALHAEPAAPPEFALAVAGHVDALGAGIGDDPLQPVLVGHQPLPRVPGELGRGQGLGCGQRAAPDPDPHAQILEDRPVRPPAAVRMVGDHFLAAGLEDAHARVPVVAVGGDLELQHRIALARIEAVLHGERLRPSLRERLVEPAAARHERVHHPVHPGDNAQVQSTRKNSQSTVTTSV